MIRSVITMKIGFSPFASNPSRGRIVDLSPSKGRSWFDKLTTNGLRAHLFLLLMVPIIGMIDYYESKLPLR
jgi:hypothetical protein